MDSRLSPVEYLLISLCRLSFTGDQVLRIKELVRQVPFWPELTDLINEHGISALIYSNLKDLGLLDQVPRLQRGVLKQSHLISLTRNTYLLDRFTEAAALLAKEDISPVVMKGLAMELTVYGNAGLRQMTDIDVMIDRERCMHTRRVLLSKGFRSAPLKSPLYAFILQWYGKHLPSLYKDDLSLEIHHNLFNWDIDLNRWFISESSTILINNVKLRIPPLNLHFLYLVKHLDYHEGNGESQLRLYTDLYLLADRYREELINDELFLLARKARIEYTLYAKLTLLKHFWGLVFIDVPKPGNWNKVLKEFLHFLNNPKGNPVSNKPESYREVIKNIPGFHRKLIFMLGDLFPSMTFMKQRYKTRNRLFTIFYYPHRLGKLVYLLKGPNYNSDSNTEIKHP
ncbi:MAG TPA: nucleotidyltransferase family protein [Bacteroidales bacterium]|nr:nucleotidyltransferase family protein [Bacteroidales bacterium]